ncbi:sensor domain-containing diguanylate cyclase [Acinetobacter sp. MD2(2019)]|uniref:sensor domain-containing diguanylate cyclase n=1 Tax=Acinetobacter sp. MD2(2019) TaxID=2605273 RepID=UPI002D1F5B83|nr:sensor domain-containing diguanylate cyclase [Acinetobacter sp. MD2(2019)]MEB3754409.1 sensor domain-containing diguanylate cyclase [Acinetobacter sp. MD2(2019)]
MNMIDSSVFDLAPIPMWLEDFSEVKALFDEWRAQGITDLVTFLQNNPSKITESSQRIKVLKVNQKTLEVFHAKDQAHLCSNLHLIFKEEMLPSHIYELAALWEGKTEFTSTSINYTITGQCLDVQVRATVLPGFEHDLSRILLTTEDISAYQNARRLEQKNRQLAQSMFVYSPTSLWVEDFSRVKERIDQLKALGIDDFRTFLDVHHDFIEQCIQDIVILDVNQATLDLFKAANKEILFKNMHKVFTKEMNHTFREQLIELWKGNIHHQREAINYALDGTIRNVLLQFTVFPGYEDNWKLVQVALTDITARKKAENYLEYLGKHDVLTKLFNRTFFTEEVNRIQRSAPSSISCIYLDLNGLKAINDALGHDTGDDILRRIGVILNQVVLDTKFSASRIGGDEFVILMPNTTEEDVDGVLHTIYELVNIDNQFHSRLPISLSIGYATSTAHETLEQALKRADEHMYLYKRNYYKENIEADLRQ